MSDFEEVKRNVAQAFSNVVRSSSSAEKLDQQQMLIVITQLMGSLQPGHALDLTPLEKFLKEEKRLMQGEVEELLVFLDSRAEHLGQQFQLPVSMQNLPEARRTKIIERFKKAPKSTTQAGRKDPPPGQPAARQETQFDKRKPKAKGGPNRSLHTFGALFILFGGAFVAYDFSQRGGKPKPIPVVDDPDALECLEIWQQAAAVICRMDKAVYDKMSPDERRLKADVFKSHLAERGVKRIFVVDAAVGTPLPI